MDRDDVGSFLDIGLEDNLRELRNNLQYNLWASLRVNLFSSLRTNLLANLWLNLRVNLLSSLRSIKHEQG